MAAFWPTSGNCGLRRSTGPPSARAAIRDDAGGSSRSAWSAPNFGRVAATKVPRPTAASRIPSWVTIW